MKAGQSILIGAVVAAAALGWVANDWVGGNGAPTPTLSALQLVEAGINLTGLSVVSDELRCSGAATFMIKTRS